MLSCPLLAQLPAAQAFGGRDRAEDLWARGKGIPAGGGRQHGLRRGDDDLRVQRRNEVANAAVQNVLEAAVLVKPRPAISSQPWPSR
jgi:hypothetical protein